MDYEALGREPISPDSPAGADIQDEPLFEALDAEISKSVSMTAGGADWDKVVGLATEILKSKSKHLLVACYLCVALARKQGLRGLAAGSEVLHALLRTHWDAMFPPLRRMRARKNAIEWWSEQIQALVPGLKSETWKISDRDKFAADLNAIDSFLSDHLENAPLLRPLFEEIGRLVVYEAPRPAPAPVPDANKPAVQAAAAATAAPPAPKPAAPAAPAAPVESAPKNPERLVNQGMEVLLEAASLLMDREPMTALPFRLNRLASWLPVEELPPAREGVTFIQPPEATLIESFNRMSQAGNWRGVLDEVESSVRRFLFWVDLNRHSAEALQKLGKPELASVVIDETWDYLERLPGVERLAFSNGMPFADAETLEWLREIKTRHESSGGASAPAPADDIAQMVAAEVAAAQDAAGAKSLAPVLANFNDRMRHCGSARDRLHWQLGLCRVLLRAKKAHLAAVHISEILRSIEQYGVCSWEPELAVDALATVLACVRAQPDAFEDGLGDSVLGKMALVNPARALDYV